MRSRRYAAAALPVCMIIGLTAAQLVQRHDVEVDMRGVAFSLESAGSTQPGWVPQEHDWHSSDDLVVLEMLDDTPAVGVPITLRVAVRNSAGVPADVVASFTDGGAGDRDFFEALQVEVTEGGVTLGEGSAAELRVALPGPVLADRAEPRVLDISVTTPISGDSRWVDSRTDLHLQLDGMTR